MTIRAGTGEPLVLLHGVTGSERMWRRTMPLLAPHHDTVAFTALGHRGGRTSTGPVTIAAVVDDAERELDRLGFERPHLAGNSMGGWVALELARRRRARTVCALSPAGCWAVGDEDQRRSRGRLRRVSAMTRAGRPFLPSAGHLPIVRRLSMREVASHGDRLDTEELVDLADDLLGCEAREDLLATTEALAPLDPAPCPVLVAWAAEDRIFPPARYGARARALMPGAEYVELPGVGHVPMLDDPALVAETILMSTADRHSPPPVGRR